jgi:hypothetical protein
MDDVDTLFPAPAAPAKGDVDTLFPAAIEQRRKAGVQDSPIQDLIFGDETVSPIARVLNGFGVGAGDSWGQNGAGVSDTILDELKKVGIKADDWLDKQNALVKAANVALIRPAAQSFYNYTKWWTSTANRAIAAGMGGLVGAAEAVHPGAGTLVEAASDPGLAATLGPFGGAIRLLSEPLRLVETARANRIIGRGEAGWAGTAPVEEVKPAAPTVVPQPEKAVQPTAAAAPQAAAAPVAAVPPDTFTVPNIHAAARAAQPELFTRYDTLVQQQDALRGWLVDRETEGRTEPGARAWLDGVNKEVDELSPQVAQAYRAAADTLGTPTVAPEGSFRSMAEMLAAQGEAAAGPAPAVAEAAAAAPRTIEEQRAFIANDVAQKLVAAGRPAEEAQAAGAVMAARYETRAARFNGALGTAEELYRREGPEIRGGRGAPSAAEAERPPQAPTGAEAKIDNSHTVVSGANSSRDPNGPVYVDPDIPEFSPTLKYPNGQPVRLWTYLADHEIAERKEMIRFEAEFKQQHGRDPTDAEWNDHYDNIAHPKVANPAERAALKADGVDIKAYDEEIDGYLSKIEKKPNTNPPPDTITDPEADIGHHRSENKATAPAPVAPAKTKVEGYASIIADIDKSGMIENAEAYRAAAKKRREAGGGTVTVYKSLAQEARAHGMTVTEYGKEQKGLLSAAGEQFDAALTKVDMVPGDIPADLRSAVLDAMVHRGFGDPLEALDYATAKLEKDANYYENLDAMLAAEHVLATEEGRDLHTEIPFDTGPGPEGVGAEGARPGGAAEAVATGQYPRQAGDRPQDVWQRFLDDRTEPRKRARIATGFNDFRTRQGMAELRARSSQDWLPGNVVNVGIVKDLLVAEQRADGTFTLIAKPNEAGISRSYNTKPHAGIVRENDVNFLDATQALREPAEQPVDEYFQRRPGRNLTAEREAEGQLGLPGAERNSEAEQAQRGANAPLKPSVEQKPMDEGLFSDEKDQKELFQSQLGKVSIREGKRPIITLAKTADASTFIHETGHVFLEEIMRDAAHDAAPDVLKQDAKTVRDWLGVQTPGEIKTRHHEKFARGFEQYLREGVAPSPGLASVFAKFRDWLLRIYQTIKGLGSEITPDIRGVFDRLLAEEPQRTVIAPDLAKRPNLQDIHESDAVLTPPHEAERAFDRIAAEDARYRASLPGDIADEHRAGAAEIGTGAREPGALPPPSSASQVVTPGGLSSTELGAQLAGGADVGAEGPAVRTVQGPAGAIEPLPIGPHVPLDSLPAGKMDKVGNIRLENLNTPAAVNDSIRELYRANQAKLDAATRGVVSDQSVMDLADAMGVDPRIVANNMDRMRSMSVEDGVPLAARIWLLRDMFTKLAAEVSKTMQGDDEAAYAEAKSRFLMVHETLSGVTAEMGRGLRAFRNMGAQVQNAKDLAARLKGDDKTLFQLRQEMALGRAAETPAQVARMIAQPTFYQRFRSGIISYVINNLISGPITHATYSVGNAVLQLFHTGVEIPASALAGRVLSAVGAIQPQDRIYAAEVMPRLYGMVYGIGDGIIPSYNALKTGVSVMKGDPSGVDLFGSEVAYRPQAIPGTVGYVLETPSRAVAAIHTMHYGMNYEAEISGMAFRDAMRQGLEPNSDAFNAHVANFRMNPPDNAVAAAHQEALDMVLMHKPTFGSGQYHFQKWVNSNLLVKLVMPFIQIGTNILREGFVERTPLAFLSNTARDNLLGRNGPEAMQTQYGQVMVGTGLAMTVLGLTAQGLMTGGGPSDPKQREVLEMTGWKPYSLKIGGEYIPYRKYLSALGPLVAGTSDMYEVGHTMSDKGLTQGAAALAFGFAEVVMDETWMRGLSSAIDAARHWDRDGGKYLRNFSMEFLPWSIGLRQVASLTDPVWREVRSEMDALRAHIPGLSQGLYPVRDLWGEPMRGGVMMAPSSAVNDPATIALQKAEYFPSRVEKKIRGITLSDQQYDDFSRIAGRDAHMRISTMVANPGFDLIPLDRRKEMLKNAIDGSREMARTVVMMQPSSNILPDALAAKRAQHQETLH